MMNFRIWGSVLLCFWLSCRPADRQDRSGDPLDELKREVGQDLSRLEYSEEETKAEADSMPLSTPIVAPARIDLLTAFREIPDEYLGNALFYAPAPQIREMLLAGTAPGFRDILVERKTGFLTYNREMDGQGVITTLKVFNKAEGGILLAVEHARWDQDQIRSEALFLLEKFGDSWMEAGKARLLPKISLQDFYEKDVHEITDNPEHIHSPILIFELIREEPRIDVYLGAYSGPEDTFQYEGDFDRISLFWKDGSFVLQPRKPAM